MSENDRAFKSGGVGVPVAPQVRLPEDYLPTDEELIALVEARPGASLRELCGELWPALPWAPLTGSGDSVTQDLRVFPAGKGTTRRLTTADWLLDKMQRLVAQGRLRFGPQRRDEPDRQAAVCYFAATPPRPSGEEQLP